MACTSIFVVHKLCQSCFSIDDYVVVKRILGAGNREARKERKWEEGGKNEKELDGRKDKEEGGGKG